MNCIYAFPSITDVKSINSLGLYFHDWSKAACVVHDCCRRKLKSVSSWHPTDDLDLLYVSRPVGQSASLHIASAACENS